MTSTTRTLWQFRELVGSLVARELKARYRGSALGFLWSLINPLLLLGVYSLVFGLILKGGRFVGSGVQTAYSLYLVVGLFPWIWFQSSLLESTVSLSTNSGLLRKAVFPAQVLPAVSALSNLVHFLLALPILLGALAIGRVMGEPVLGWASLLIVPVIAMQLLLVLGLGLGLSALNVHFKDVRDLLANVLQLLFFLAPIIYSLEFLPATGGAWQVLHAVIRINPMTPFVLAYQDLLLAARLPDWSLWLQMATMTAIATTSGAWIFRRLEDTLAEAA